MKKVKLSLAPKTLDASKSVKFRSETVEFENLEKTLKSQNYSLINWKIDEDLKGQVCNRYRKADYFESSSGIVIDIDSGLKIDAAADRLKKLGLNYIIITSKSHSTSIEKRVFG